MTPWLDAKTYYTRRWGEPVGRVGVDGGFSCPNRGPDRKEPGCSFCSESANRPPYQTSADDLESQVVRGTSFQRERYGYQRFSLYFQSFSSTWAPVEALRLAYDRALAAGSFVELVVGTRPDCLPVDVVDLLATYQNPDREVWIELGLQSSRDETLTRVRRGHNVSSFRAAAARLRERGLKFTVHALFGLPGEGPHDFVETVRFALEQGASGLKLHDLLLVPGTPLFRDWERGLVAPVDPEAYLEACVEALLLVPPHVVVWRTASDPEDRQATRSPGEKWPKNRFLHRLRAEIEKRRTSSSR